MTQEQPHINSDHKVEQLNQDLVWWEGEGLMPVECGREKHFGRLMKKSMEWESINRRSETGG